MKMPRFTNDRKREINLLNYSWLVKADVKDILGFKLEFKNDKSTLKCYKEMYKNLSYYFGLQNR